MNPHPFRQRTLKQRASLEGVGLHSGAKVRVTVAPAPADTGIVFERVDLTPRVEIPAIFERVVDTNLNTSLGVGEVRVGTVEHLLAALVGCGIDNARIEVHGPEVPILDGSAAPFVQLVQDAGIHEQRATRRYLLVSRPVVVQDGDKSARLLPARNFSISYTIDFKHPLISDQRYRVDLTERAFQREIARARTFGFKRDVERLHKAGLARGGSLENAVVVDDFHILNPEGLRFPDEFVRHKILDAIGDLALLGMPVIGHFEAVKSGHALNYALVRKALTEPGLCEVVQPREQHELSELQEQVPVLAGLGSQIA
ncbi:MAG TPA: UDP-3-O-acyl-N-acetylglucosamine deacetylase [Myxococcales bacterium]|nr:UDP-3-O-acyl-N-acetylglucosamine deacetylase [Myxococcales bacterium]